MSSWVVHHPSREVEALVAAELVVAARVESAESAGLAAKSAVELVATAWVELAVMALIAKFAKFVVEVAVELEFESESAVVAVVATVAVSVPIALTSAPEVEPAAFEFGLRPRLFPSSSFHKVDQVEVLLMKRPKEYTASKTRVVCCVSWWTRSRSKDRNLRNYHICNEPQRSSSCIDRTQRCGRHLNDPLEMMRD